MNRCCERCGIEEGSEDYPYELNCLHGEMICEECEEEFVEEYEQGAIEWSKEKKDE